MMSELRESIILCKCGWRGTFGDCIDAACEDENIEDLTCPECKGIVTNEKYEDEVDKLAEKKYCERDPEYAKELINEMTRVMRENPEETQELIRCLEVIESPLNN